VSGSLSRRAMLYGAGAAAAMPALPARAQTTPTIRIGWLPSENAVQPFYAVDQGFLARAGLNAELTIFANSQAISNAVAANAIDVGAADMIQVANGFIHGIPFSFFAGGAIYSSTAPTLQLLVAKDAPYKTAKDLEGQSVAVIALNSISAISLQEWLHVNGADVSKVKIFEAPFTLMLPGLQRGTFAAALFAEPFVTSAMPECRVLGKTYDVVADRFYILSWFASRPWLKTNPDTAKRFASAIYETARWANAHRNESATILSGVTKVPVETIRAMNRASFATSLDAKLMQPVLDIAYRYRAIDKPVTAADLIQAI